MTARSLPSFCLHRIRSDRTAAAPPPICAKDDDGKAEEKDKGCGAVAVGRKVMVVADDGGDEARTALQWALSHSVRPCDTVVLLDVVRSTGAKKGKLTKPVYILCLLSPYASMLKYGVSPNISSCACMFLVNWMYIFATDKEVLFGLC
jgi:hypothetical protein